jgi:hypothetical protein
LNQSVTTIERGLAGVILQQIVAMEKRLMDL